MAPRTRLASTLDPAKVEHAGVAVGTGRSLASNRLVVTADAVEAAASAAAAAASQAAAAASQAAAAESEDLAAESEESATDFAVAAYTSATEAAASAAAAAATVTSKVAKAGDTMTGDLTLESTLPAVRWSDTDGTTNKRKYTLRPGSDALWFTAFNDAWGGGADRLKIKHDGGVNVIGGTLAFDTSTTYGVQLGYGGYLYDDSSDSRIAANSNRFSIITEDNTTYIASFGTSGTGSTIDSNVVITGNLTVSNTYPYYFFKDTNAAAGGKNAAWNYVDGLLQFIRWDDTFTTSNVDFTSFIDGTASVRTAPPAGDNSGKLVSSYWIRQELGASAGNGFPERFMSKGTLPGYYFWDTDAAADRKRGQLSYNASNFAWDRYTDAGAYIDTPFYINTQGNSVFHSAIAVHSEIQIGAVTSGGVGYVKIHGGAAGNAGYIGFHLASGVRQGYIGWGASSNLEVDMEATGGVFLTRRGGIGSEYGYQGRAGYNGGVVGSWHNWQWTGSSLVAWVDTTNIGTVQMVCDERNKKFVKPLTGNALQQITAVKPVTFRWRDRGIFKDDGKEYTGFTAQDLAEHVPAAVTEGLDEDKTQSVNIIPLMATMVKAIQELTLKVTALEARNGPPNTPSGPEGPETPQASSRRGPRAGHRAGGKRAAQKGKGNGVRKVAPVQKGPRRKAADLPAKGNRRR